ncbi:NAD(P)H-binding protein [Streptomyces sp. CBMA123]|uniref:NAD(P)H-binding protein n=1 Tax=Streptomyces sp. CBMA123 TaxID=1896313 RepID=UPI001661CD04|nr:NAD(P)H-binding protein [Streptomyces sp. CBMA123]MBD0693401.1 hypothetical protein [Streptomyces sp. CBMA123]
MRIAVLGATGRVGRHAVEQVLGRGHEVVALVRRPQAHPQNRPQAHPVPGQRQPAVEVRRADVTEPAAFPDLWAGGVSTGRRTVPLEDYATPLLPPHASRATVAAPMLDEAERPAHGARILVPVGHA